MLPEHIVECLGHQRLQAAALAMGQYVPREGNVGREEAGDLLQPRWLGAIIAAHL